MKNANTLLKKEEQATYALRELYGRYGYAQYKMSKFEEYDLYVRNKSFLISDSVITFTDTNGKLMALKPDVTLSIVKNTKDIPGHVQKVYYNENVYRVTEKSHSFREILQTGLECLGDVDDYCIAEVLSLAAQSLALISDDYILDVSHLGLLSRLIDHLALSPEITGELLECVAQKNAHDAARICAEAGVDEKKSALLMRLMSCTGDVRQTISELYALLPDADWQSAVAQLDAVLSVLPQEHVRIDFSVIHDLRYYSGIVFQGFVKGVPENILSGGQYDNLMHRMDKKSGAIGFAVYLDRLDSLGYTAKEFDVDAVLLYDENADLSALHEAVRKLTEDGTCVKALRSVPEKLTYRRLLQFTESGVNLLETNA
jgi:ATP phosphoribosyltransferase regulatory subunit